MPAFPLDPGDITAVKRWLEAQHSDHIHPLRPIEIAEILLGVDALLQLPAVVQRAGVADGATIILVMDTVPMYRGKQALKPFVQALLRDAGYTVETLWLEGDQYGLVHADFAQVQRVRAALRPGMALVALGSGSVTDIAKHAAFLYDQEQQAYQGQRSTVLYLLPDRELCYRVRGEYGGATEGWGETHDPFALSHGDYLRLARACLRSKSDDRGGIG